MQLMLQQGTDRTCFWVLRSLHLQLDREQNSWLTMKRREVSPHYPLAIYSSLPLLCSQSHPSFSTGSGTHQTFLQAALTQ